MEGLLEVYNSIFLMLLWWRRWELEEIAEMYTLRDKGGACEKDLPYWTFNMAFTLRSNLPFMCACMYVIGQCNTLPDGVALVCDKRWTRINDHSLRL